MDLPGRTANTTSKGGKIPVTVFTGFVGAGKTTIILSLLESMPKGYKFCLLKNEFGDVKVDSQIAKLQNIDVQEMTNGCLCCVLVGQMKEGLLELKEKYSPDRIIIETSGSAFPGPIAWQIRELADEGFVLDSVLNVVDCKNFEGYADNSYTAQLQAKYTDLVLLTKHEGVSPQDLDRVIDRVNDLNTDAPKVFVAADKPISPDLIFGLDTKLFQLQGTHKHTHRQDHDKHGHGYVHEHEQENGDHHENELDTMEIKCFSGRDTSHGQEKCRSLVSFEKFLGTLDKEDVYRLKGFVRLSGIKRDDGSVIEEPTICVVNHAFGKWTIIPVLDRENVAEQDDSSASSASGASTPSSQEGNVLDLHFILMGELRMIENKLIHGCGVGYESGLVKCHFKTKKHTISWDSELPGTLPEYIAQKAAKKQ
ncbi:hypothetical protein BG004_004229 [Podila humilis]|nr:hypothetical protein BG004_004229 [Podila humilis]